jgi:hypothetical protein
MTSCENNGVVPRQFFDRSVSLLRGSSTVQDISFSDRLQPIEWTLLGYATIFTPFLRKVLVSSSVQKELIPLRKAFINLAKNCTAVSPH